MAPARWSPRESAICRYLAGRDLSVTSFVAAEDGALYAVHEGHCCTLTHYVEGTVLAPNTAPHWFLGESARILGAMHRELARLPRFSDGMGVDWFEGWTPEAGVESYRSFLRGSLSAFPEAAQAQVLADVEWKLEAIPSLAPIEFMSLTRANTHGDYKIMYRDFVLPYHRRLVSAFATKGPNSIHLCGDAVRHLPTLREELDIMSFDTGFPVDFSGLRCRMGPDVTVYGGPHVELLRSSTPAQVEAEVRRILGSGIAAGGRFEPCPRHAAGESPRNVRRRPAPRGSVRESGAVWSEGGDSSQVKGRPM